MPKIKTADDASLSYPEAGDDYRIWEPRMRRFARSHRQRPAAA
jgi:hypothetical protein